MPRANRSNVERLPSEPESAGRARRFVVDGLRASGLVDLVDVATLLVSELVTNAVLHAGTEVTVRLEIHDARIRVEVTDGSTLTPAQRHYGKDALTGRGLDLVDALAVSWGVEPGEAAKTVWFELACDDATARDTLPASSVASSRPHGSPRTGTQNREVVLRGTPVALLRATAQYGDALLREVALMSLVDEPSAGRPARWQAPTMDLTPFLEQVEAAQAEGLDIADLVVSVADDGGQAALTRLSVVDEAERMAHEGLVLAAPALPEVAACSRWYLGEIARQLQGNAPQPWDPSPIDDPAVATALAAHLLRAVEKLTTPVVVADATNHIVFVNEDAARLLGWEVEDLTGRRLTAIVPATLRNSHLAGYTRFLVTGESNIIGETVEVPALRRDGTTVRVKLQITQMERGTSPVFLARITPVSAEG